ncbi:hypothetical protein DENSPDRAFT_865551 [Dentipellis sp. KUC8613]|nr:hypothetical protein DENSPDRAFT_865551 [Dentipellis sp. KUC8613]
MFFRIFGFAREGDAARTRFSESAKWPLYTILGMIVDVLDDILAFLIPHQRHKEAFFAQLHPEYGVLQMKLTVTPSVIGKGSRGIGENAADASEASALDLLSTTMIPVPHVRRVVWLQWSFKIVMDYIEGPTLVQVRRSLSTRRKLYVAFAPRRYVRQLRRFTPSTTAPPGPLSAHGPRICEPPVCGQVPEDDPSKKELFEESEPLVLIRQDINFWNIILGEDGGYLWLIGWGCGY